MGVNPYGTEYFMDWSHGLESWSGVLEWILRVEDWKEIFDCNRKLYSGDTIYLGANGKTCNHCINLLTVIK